MSLLARLNVFWLGAGGFLALFCTNEIIANRVSHAPVWLGGRMVLVACYVGLAIGLAVMAFLGIEAPPEPDADTSDEPARSEPARDEPARDEPARDEPARDEPANS
jgi:hypothetical protein